MNPTQVPIGIKESYPSLENLRQSITLLAAPGRCVHIANRESDILEQFCLAQNLGTRFLVRVQTNRLAEPSKAAPRTDATQLVFVRSNTAYLIRSAARRLPR